MKLALRGAFKEELVAYRLLNRILTITEAFSAEYRDLLPLPLYTLTFFPGTTSATQPGQSRVPVRVTPYFRHTGCSFLALSFPNKNDNILLSPNSKLNLILIKMPQTHHTTEMQMSPGPFSHFSWLTSTWQQRAPYVYIPTQSPKHKTQLLAVNPTLQSLK